MKIAFVLNSSDPFGGASKSFLLLLEGVVKAGHKAMVVLPDEGMLKNKIESLGGKVYVLNYRPNLYPYESNIIDYILWLPRLLARRMLNNKAVKKLSGLLDGVDIVHTNVSVIDIGCRAANIRGIPHVYHFREYGMPDFGFRYYPSRNRFYQTIDYAICITKDIQRYHSLDKRCNSIVVYNGIHNRVNILPQRDGTDDYLLFAGRLEKTKGIEQVLEAYSISGSSIPLKVAGGALKSSYLKKIKKMAEKLEISDRVLFLGPVADIDNLMRNANAVIVASEFEAFGRVMPEAMFQGCLVIGRDVGGTHEQFENGLLYTGHEIGLRYSTTHELAECIRCLPNVDDNMRQRAFDTVNCYYSLESNVASIIKFYNKILNK